MNFFEDLIEELKEENLIEQTVIESARDENAVFFVEENQLDDFTPENAPGVALRADATKEMPADLENELSAENAVAEQRAGDKDERRAIPAPPNLDTDNDENAAASDNEFFRRRAMEEVSALQTVEHVISGVEREHLKILPKTYNDIAVSKALHDFLQISKGGQAQENTQAEFKLLQETESWYSALSHRDKNISVGDLRRYCERTRPALSGQALTALARFYRNSPYSESVRAKFDMVITRLLTTEIEDEKRAIALSHDELVAFLGKLYASWSSITLYAAEEDSEILITTLKFEGFMNEIESAELLEDVLKIDFFNRLRLFKESTGENFYAPLVTATAVEGNVRIGNCYVDLIRREREKIAARRREENENFSTLLEEKYGFLFNETISDVTSKSVQLDELDPAQIKKAPPVNTKKEKLNYTAPHIAPRKKSVQSAEGRLGKLFAVNRWLLAALLATVVATVSMVLWVEFLAPQTATSPNVKKIDLDDSLLKDGLKAARVKGDVFYGVVQPSWDTLSPEKKEELIMKIYTLGGEKGYKKVQLLNSEGRTVGYASGQNITINNP